MAPNKTFFPFQYPIEGACDQKCAYFNGNMASLEPGEHCRLTHEQPDQGDGKCYANTSWSDKDDA